MSRKNWEYTFHNNRSESLQNHFFIHKEENNNNQTLLSKFPYCTPLSKHV